MMFLSSVLILGAFSPASKQPAASDHAALRRGEVLSRNEVVQGSDFPLTRGYALIDAPPAKVFALIDKCGNYSKVMPRTAESKELSRRGNVIVCKVVIELPFFMGNLTSITRGVHTIGPPFWGRSWKLISGTFKHNTGLWTMRPYRGDPSVTLVEYALHALPTIYLPDALLERAAGKGVPNMLRSLRKVLTGKEKR
jgi:ribosome-associated toxin RatA of RatAB toxin-antitoxin module